MLISDSSFNSDCETKIEETPPNLCSTDGPILAITVCVIYGLLTTFYVLVKYYQSKLEDDLPIPDLASQRYEGRHKWNSSVKYEMEIEMESEECKFDGQI